MNRRLPRAPSLIAAFVAGVLLIALLIFAVSHFASRDSTETPKRDAVERDYQPEMVYPTHFPPIVDFEVVSVKAAAEEVADSELVLGVEVGGETRAYPLNMITGPQREFVNDTLGGLPIAPTWCDLCHTGIVYVRNVDKQTLTLCCSGMMWNRNVLMLDLETHSLWSQILGVAMDGPFKGTKLDVIPSTLTDWDTWRRTHPDTTVLQLSHTAREYHRRFYRNLSEFVIGMAQGTTARAWPFDELQKHGLANDIFVKQPVLVLFDEPTATATVWSRIVNGDELSFQRQGNEIRDLQTGSLWDPTLGVALDGPLVGRKLKQMPAVVSYRRAWLAFHPETGLWPAM